MVRTISVIILAGILAFSAAAQGKSADAIKKQIGSDKAITLTYDQGSDSTKIMAIADNFAQKESERAGTRAINFAMAFTFAGKTLASAPERVNLTFWVLTKKPQFAATHHWMVTVGDKTVDLGDARYAAKSSEDMEYLNFVVSMEDLKKIAATGARLKIGNADLTFTDGQAALLTKFINIATP